MMVVYFKKVTLYKSHVNQGLTISCRPILVEVINIPLYMILRYICSYVILLESLNDSSEEMHVYITSFSVNNSIFCKFR